MPLQHEWVILASALGAFLTAIWNGRRIKANAEERDRQLSQIHTLVNSRLTDALEEIVGLRKELHEAKATIEALERRLDGTDA